MGQHGFLRNPQGVFATFDASTIEIPATYVESINDGGAITGFYSPPSIYHGFVRDPQGTITFFDVPGSDWTAPRSIHKSGAIVGQYLDAGFGSYGFVRDPQGIITTFDAPNAWFTFAYSINSTGVIAGFYFDFSGTVHGFVRR